MGQRDIHYCSKCYIQREAEPMIFGCGIHGQFLFLDRVKKLAVVWFASRKSRMEIHFLKTFKTFEKIRALVS